MIDPRASLLIAGCVLFAALIVAELYAGADGTVAPPAPATPVDEVRTPPPAQPARPEDLLATALARPLFSATRRPPETAASDGAGGPELSDKRLSGIVIEPDRRLAIFAVTGAKPLTLSEGESVSGWRIESITPTEISLVSPSGTRTLQPTLEPASVAQARPPRGNAAPRPAAPVQNAPAQGAAQPPGAPPRAAAAARRPVGAQAPPAVPANRAQAAQPPAGAPQNAAAAPYGIVRPSPRP